MGTKTLGRGPSKLEFSSRGCLLELPLTTLRHSVITDLIRDGLPALTVAQISGTSIAMIEHHYGHLVRDDAERALGRLAL